MIIIKLIVLVTFVEVTLGTNVGNAEVPSPPAIALTTEEIMQRPEVVHKVFSVKQQIEPVHHYRYGYEVTDPITAITTNQYEIRYSDVNIGIFNTVGTKGGQRSTVNYSIDATERYRATLTVDSQEYATLDYAHSPSPLATSTPPSTVEKEAFTNFHIDDKENIDKHSPNAKSAYKTYNFLVEFFKFQSTPDVYSWGYEMDGIRSQYETYRGASGEGRITMVDSDGCVSSMDYTLDANNFNVSTVRHFGKQDISQLYLNPEQYPLLLQIARGPPTCAL